LGADPHEIRPGLLCRTLLPDNDDCAATQVLNLSGKNHTLPAGLRLGEAEIGQFLGSLLVNDVPDGSESIDVCRTVECQTGDVSCVCSATVSDVNRVCSRANVNDVTVDNACCADTSKTVPTAVWLIAV